MYRPAQPFGTAQCSPFPLSLPASIVRPLLPIQVWHWNSYLTSSRKTRRLLAPSCTRGSAPNHSIALMQVVWCAVSQDRAKAQGPKKFFWGRAWRTSLPCSMHRPSGPMRSSSCAVSQIGHAMCWNTPTKDAAVRSCVPVHDCQLSAFLSAEFCPIPGLKANKEFAFSVVAQEPWLL